MRLGWLTDIYLSFVPADLRAALYESIRRESLDAILIGGDIGEAPNLRFFLAEIGRELRLPIYFVLGNHDFYGSSISAVRELVATASSASPFLKWLPATGIAPLTPSRALIGHGAWADGRRGDFFGSTVRLNDYVHISELAGLTKEACYAKLNTLGDEATHLEQTSRAALAQGYDILLLTHVPPFREACWHEGGISSDPYLPHFSCKAVGDALMAVMSDFPTKNMTVLCGHTHSSGIAQILPNLTVYTGAAVYGAPRLQMIFEL